MGTADDVVRAAQAVARDYTSYPSGYGNHPQGSPFALLMAAVAAHDRHEVFEFVKAMRHADVRTYLDRCGLASGETIVVGRHTPKQDATFRVWRNPDVPGGWTGERITR